MRGERGAVPTPPPPPALFFFHTEAAGRGDRPRAARGAKPSGRSPSGQERVVGLLPTAFPASPLQPSLDGQQ